MRKNVLILILSSAAGLSSACDEDSALLDAASPSTGNPGGNGAFSDAATPGAVGSTEAGPPSNVPWQDAGPAPAQDAGGGATFDAGSTGNSPTQDGGVNAARDGGASTTADGGATSPSAYDYGAKGPFGDAKMFPGVGPEGTYFLFRPDTSLGRDGFKHPIGVWGNGIGTTPDLYQVLLGHIASHGFVVVACPDIISEEPCLDTGLSWLAQQNTGTGPLAGKLDTSKEFALGFSWGGGAAIDVSKRPNIKATISVHGMPPRNNPWASLRAPLALFSGLGDWIVSVDGPVTENFNNSMVPTFFATMQKDTPGHMFAMDPESTPCKDGTAESIGAGPCTGAREEQAPIVAWLRYWVSGDQNARSYFYGDDCKLCNSEWKVQRKNWQ
jgi:hypothetical protein